MPPRKCTLFLPSTKRGGIISSNIPPLARTRVFESGRLDAMTMLDPSLALALLGPKSTGVKPKAMTTTITNSTAFFQAPMPLKPAAKRVVVKSMALSKGGLLVSAAKVLKKKVERIPKVKPMLKDIKIAREKARRARMEALLSPAKSESPEGVRSERLESGGSSVSSKVGLQREICQDTYADTCEGKSKPSVECALLKRKRDDDEVVFNNGTATATASGPRLSKKVKMTTTTTLASKKKDQQQSSISIDAPEQSSDSRCKHIPFFYTSKGICTKCAIDAQKIESEKKSESPCEDDGPDRTRRQRCGKSTGVME